MARQAGAYPRSLPEAGPGRKRSRRWPRGEKFRGRGAPAPKRSDVSGDDGPAPGWPARSPTTRGGRPRPALPRLASGTTAVGGGRGPDRQRMPDTLMIPSALVANGAEDRGLADALVREVALGRLPRVSLDAPLPPAARPVAETLAADLDELERDLARLRRRRGACRAQTAGSGWLLLRPPCSAATPVT